MKHLISCLTLCFFLLGSLTACKPERAPAADENPSPAFTTSASVWEDDDEDAWSEPIL